MILALAKPIMKINQAEAAYDFLSKCAGFTGEGPSMLR